MKTLLDTHVVIWLVIAPNRISPLAEEAIKAAQDSGTALSFSAVSLYEIAYLIRARRILLSISEQAFMAAIRSGFNVLPVSAEIAVFAAQLPTSLHGDPLDRMIAATAVIENRTLITADRKLLDSGVCNTLW